VLQHKVAHNIGDTEMKFQIIDTKIIDLNEEYDYADDECSLSAISIEVEFKLNDELFTLQYQTSTTLDYGAVSSILEVVDNNYEYDAFLDWFDSEINDFCLVIKELRKKVQPTWNKYVDDNYIRGRSFYDGNFMDANSEEDTIKRKGVKNELSCCCKA